MVILSSKISLELHVSNKEYVCPSQGLFWMNVMVMIDECHGDDLTLTWVKVMTQSPEKRASYIQWNDL